MKPIYTLLLLLIPITLIAQVQDLEYTIFDSSNGFVDDEVSVLFTDSNGTLWIGTDNSGIFAYENDEFTQYNEDLLTGRVSSFAEDSDGNLWVGFYHSSMGGVMRFDGTSFIDAYTPSDQVSIGRVIDVLVTEEDELCILESSNYYNAHTFNIVKTDTIESYPLGEIDETQTYRSDILQLEDGSIWINWLYYIAIYKDGVMKGDSIPIDMPFPTNSIREIELDDEGRIWLARDELIVTDPEGRWWTYMEEDTFDDEYIPGYGYYSYLYNDSYGRMWFSTPEYINFIKDGKIYTFNGLEFKGEMMEDWDGNIWVGTDEDKLIRIENVSPDEIIEPEFPPFITSTAINDFGIDIDTTELEYYKKIEYEYESGIFSSNIISLLSDSQNRLWIGTKFGEIYCLIEDSLIFYSYLSNGVFDYIPLFSFSNLGIQDIEEDGFGNIWFVVTHSKFGGLYQLEGDKIVSKMTKGNNSLLSKYMRKLHIDTLSNTKWVSSFYTSDLSSNGLQIIKSDTIINFIADTDSLSSFAYIRDIEKRPNTDRFGISGGEWGYFEIDTLGNIYEYNMPYESSSSTPNSGNIEYGGAHDIWYVRPNHELIYYDEGLGWGKYEGYYDEDTRSLAKDKFGHMWITLKFGDVYKLQNDQFTFITNIGPPNSATDPIVEDKEGNMWLIGDDGLVKLIRNPIDITSADSISLLEEKFTNTENIKTNYRVYPNPVDDILTIKGVKEPLYYQFYDIRGSIVSIDHLKSNNKIDVSDYKAGIYSLVLFNENHLSVHKIIVE